MKRQLLLVVMVLGLPLITFSQEVDCKNFRNGTFKLVNEGLITIIKRSGTHQTEIFNNSKIPTEYFVEWIDDCTYTLKPKEATFKKYPDIPKGAQLTVKIFRTTKNSYVQTSTSNFNEMSVTSEVIKIK
jgi:hypothetical protein